MNKSEQAYWRGFIKAALDVSDFDQDKKNFYYYGRLGKSWDQLDHPDKFPGALKQDAAGILNQLKKKYPKSYVTDYGSWIPHSRMQPGDQPEYSAKKKNFQEELVRMKNTGGISDHMYTHVRTDPTLLRRILDTVTRNKVRM